MGIIGILGRTTSSSAPARPAVRAPRGSPTRPVSLGTAPASQLSIEWRAHPRSASPAKMGCRTVIAAFRGFILCSTVPIEARKGAARALAKPPAHVRVGLASHSVEVVFSIAKVESVPAALHN